MSMTDAEINKAIAETVMGLIVVNGFSEVNGERLVLEIPSWGYWNNAYLYFQDYSNEPELIPDYCSDLNAAFEAWDKARLTNPHDFNDFTVASIMDAYTVYLHDVLVAAPNPAKALCLAILKAKGVIKNA